MEMPDQDYTPESLLNGIPDIHKIDFIEQTMNHPYRDVVVNLLHDNPRIQTVVEVGPGQLVEYQKCYR